MGRVSLRWMAVLLAAALVMALAGCGRGAGDASGSSGDTLKIGAVLSLSGTYSGLGQPEKNAIEMEVARINEAGGVNGRKVEVVIEDDATDAAKAQAAAAKLIEQDEVVAIVGATGTGQTMAIRPDAERAGVPVVSMAGGSVITDDFSPLVFQTPWPNRLVVPFTVKGLLDPGSGKPSVALLSDSGGYGKDGRDVALKELEKAGIKVVADEVFNPGDTDMTPQLAKIKAADADIVWLWSAGKEAAIVAKQAVDLWGPAHTAGRPAVNLLGAPGNARVEFVEGAGDGAQAFTFAAGKILLPEAYGKDSDAYKVATDFIERYQAKYGKAPDIFAGHAYDALNIVVDAAKRVEGDVTPTKLRDEIEATKGFVGVGGTFTYSPSDHNGLTEADLVMYRVDQGKWVLRK